MSQERPIRLAAGAWSVEFERTSGWVRAIRLGAREVVRAVYSAVRSENWETLSQRVVHSHVLQGNDSFSASWRIEVDEVSYQWEGSLTCDGQSLEISWNGEAGQSFLTRRTGLCLLLPRELAGSTVTAQLFDGSKDRKPIPQTVDPNAPFKPYSRLEFETDGASCQIEFRGAGFGIEDQRNWTDASFKCYCETPAFPNAYKVNQGSLLSHTVRLNYVGEAGRFDRVACIDVTEGDHWFAIPRLGTVAAEPTGLASFNLEPLDTLDWSNAGLGTVFAVSGNFVDLNRNRPDMDEWDGVAFPVSPQVHAVDDRTIMENLWGLYDAAKSAKAIAGNKSVCVGPIRFAKATIAYEDPIHRRISPAWAVAVVAILSEAKADAICLLDGEDWTPEIREALILLAGQRELKPMRSQDPYQVYGFSLRDGRCVLINLKPYSVPVCFGDELQLEPYQIRVLAEGSDSSPPESR